MRTRRLTRTVPIFIASAILIATASAAERLMPQPTAAGTESVPLRIAFQGFLTDGGGTPLDGPVNLDLALYDASSGGSALWLETHLGVPVTQGAFAVELGSVVPLDPLDFATSGLWLGIRVDGNPELPRAALLAAAFALRSKSAEVADALAPGVAVTSLNALTSDVSLVGGTNVTITPGGNTLVIDAASVPDTDWVVNGDDLSSGVMGNVGIGATSPSAKLTVESLAAADGIDVENTSVDGDPQIRFRLRGTNQVTMGVDDSATDAFRVVRGGTLGPSGAGISLSVSNDVGIGTMSPSRRLELSSNALADGLDIDNTNVDGDSQIRFKQSGTSQVAMGLDASASNAFRIVRGGSTSPVGGINLDENNHVGMGAMPQQEILRIKQRYGLPFNAGLVLENADEYGSSEWEFAIDNNNLLYLSKDDEVKGYWSTTSGAYFAISDRRRKHDVQDLGAVLEQVSRLRPVRYRFNGQSTDQLSIGFIAQELQPLLPEAVGVPERADGDYAINYDTLSVIAIRAIQEQQAMIDALLERVAELEKGGH